METLKNSAFVLSRDGVQEEVICPFSVNRNLERFAERHSIAGLEKAVQQTKYVAYSNFDDKEVPDADVI